MPYGNWLRVGHSGGGPSIMRPRMKIPRAHPLVDHRPKTETHEPIRAHDSTPDTIAKSGSHAASFPSIVRGVKFFHERGNMLG